MNNTAEQKNIYVDMDEEITTVIDNLRQTSATNIALIVPQRALILQSVVNLKLLAQEVKKYGKSIILVTQDEDGTVFAQKAGLTVRPFMPERDISSVQQDNTYTHQPQQNAQPMQNISQQGTVMQSSQGHMPKQTVMPRQQYGDINTAVKRQGFKSANNDGNAVHNEPQQVNQLHNKSRNVSGVVRGANIGATHFNNPLQNRNEQESYHENSFDTHQNYQQSHEHMDEGFSDYEQSLHEARVSVSGIRRPSDQSEYIIHQSVDKKAPEKKKKTKKRKKKTLHDVSMSKTTGVLIKSFIFGGVAIVCLIGLIVILPKTDITVDPKHISIDEKIDITAKADQSSYDVDRRLIPTRLIERDITFTKTFNATGSGDVDAQKAQGTITIFNEFSSAPQPIVEKTRFLAEDGTLFRLVNATTIPGMNGSEPGKVEALVEADESGESGNIGPTRFSIPGFSSSDKRDKFYATSETAMTGGGAGGTGVTVVTADDISRAKAEMTSELPQYIIEQVEGLLRPENEVLADGAMQHDTIRSEASVREGTMSEQFMYEIVAHTKNLVFSEDDILAVLESGISKKHQQYSSDQTEIELKYNNVDADFENKTLKMSVQGIVDIVATIDVESFHNDIVNKKHNELLEIMEGEYSDEIEKITIESVKPGFPVFIANKISRLRFMTSISVNQ